MENVIQQVVTQLGTFGIIMVFIFYFIKKYIEKNLDIYFTSIEKLTNVVEELKATRFNQTVEVYKNISILVNRLRLNLKELIEDPSSNRAKALCELTEQYQSLLYASELLLD